MTLFPDPPPTHQAFLRRFPELGRAWEMTSCAGLKGPLPEHSVRLVKLAIALGAMKEGAVHSAVRKALACGIPREAIEQVIALCASILGMPSTVAVFTWVEDELRLQERGGDPARRGPA